MDKQGNTYGKPLKIVTPEETAMWIRRWMHVLYRRPWAAQS